MAARDLGTILAADWDTDNYTTPDFINGNLRSHHTVAVGLIYKRIRMITESMGIINRTKYTPDSHHAYQIWCVEKSTTNAEDMAEEAKRVCAAFTPTTTEKQLTWEGGEWDENQPYRAVFTFVIFVKISGVTIG